MSEADAVSQTVEPEPTIDDTMSKVFDRMEGESRDDSGRFTPRNAPDGATDGDAGKKSSDADKSKAGEAATPPIVTPKSWSDEERTEFSKLPPEVQKIILKREGDRDSGFTRKSEELANERKRLDAISRVVAPIESAARKYGVSPDIAIQQMFERHQDIEQNGIEGLKRLAKVYGISLEAGTSQDVSGDPELAALKQELSTIKSELTGFKSYQTQASRTALEREIDAVRDEKGDDGKPIRPHFEAIYDDMAPIAAALRAQNPSWPITKLMAEAYDRAAHANPEIRVKIAAEKEAKAKGEEERKAKEAALKARKAVENNTRVRGVHSGGTAKPKSFEETMARVYDERAA